MAEKKKPAHPSIRLELPLNGRLKGLLRVLAAVLLLPSAGYTVRLALEPNLPQGAPPRLGRGMYPHPERLDRMTEYYVPLGWQVADAWFSEDGRSALVHLESDR